MLYIGGLCIVSNDNDVLEQQLLRRKRIERIKFGIIWTIAIWMLASLIAIIILSIQVIKLNLKVSEIYKSGKYESEIGSSQFANIVTGIDTEENFAKEGDTHYVYLTFNSVPGDNTNAILDVLAQYQVKATFFVVGSEDEKSAEVYRRIVQEGHTIGMHSYSNQYSLIYSSKDAFKEDYKKLSDYIYELTGTKSVYYRFPGGSGNEISSISMAEFVYILNQENITYYDWNVSAGDAANSYTVDTIVKNVEEGVSKYKTSVVLLHDGENKSTTVDALGPLIDRLKNQGAVILPIDEDTNVIQYMKAESVK